MVNCLSCEMLLETADAVSGRRVSEMAACCNFILETNTLTSHTCAVVCIRLGFKILRNSSLYDERIFNVSKSSALSIL